MIPPPCCHHKNTGPCLLLCLMLEINQPVGQIDTNQWQTVSHPAWLPISEMVGTTHRVPSALHFISKSLYHLSALLLYTLWTLSGVKAAVRLWPLLLCLVGYQCGVIDGQKCRNIISSRTACSSFEHSFLILLLVYSLCLIYWRTRIKHYFTEICYAAT